MENSEISCIESKIESTIVKYGMLKDVKTLVIGVSGGADSMALLKFFEAYSKKNNLKIVAAHVNHCLRGKESDSDENFVREYCSQNGIALEIFRVNVKDKAAKAKKSIEEYARKLRYDFFYELSDKYNGKIATAHTLSDSIETMLINLTRGTGTIGLCGISAQRDKIIRPLIELKRAETQTYCEKNNIAYVTDSTNLSREYTRNKIRLDVIAQLKQINPEFEVVAARTIKLLKADEAYLNEIAENHLKESFISEWTYSTQNVKKQSFPILSRFIRLAVTDFLKDNVTARHIELILSLIENNAGSVTLPKGVKVTVKDGILSIRKIESQLSLAKNKSEIPFKIGFILTEDSEKFIIKVVNKSEFERIKKLPFFYLMDYNKISTKANFRTRTSGDKFCQAGRGVTKSVKKLFNELKIPQNKRESVLMLADKDKILWINGIGVAESVKVDENTKKIVAIYSENSSKHLNM